MCELFPNIPSEEIEKAVENCGGSINAAASFLIDCKSFNVQYVIVYKYISIQFERLSINFGRSYGFKGRIVSQNKLCILCFRQNECILIENLF